jgi:hypothetical protein
MTWWNTLFYRKVGRVFSRPVATQAELQIHARGPPGNAVILSAAKNLIGTPGPA